MVRGGRVHDRAILDALESLPTEAIERDVWRVVRKGRDPLRGAVANGRWNAVGEFEVVYTSLTSEGALAEVGYRLSLEPVWPSRIEHELHNLKIKADRALKLENLQQLEKLGVNVARFESFEYSATQAVAAAAHFLEFDALIVPSARYPCHNLVLFLDRLAATLEMLSTNNVDWSVWRANARRYAPMNISHSDLKTLVRTCGDLRTPAQDRQYAARENSWQAVSPSTIMLAALRAPAPPPQ